MDEINWSNDVFFRYVLFNILIRKKVFFFQAEDGIRDPLWSRGLGDVYKRQGIDHERSVEIGKVHVW